MVYLLSRIICDVLSMEKNRLFPGNSGVTRMIPVNLINLINKKKSPIVEQVFLIHRDGRLISYTSLKGGEYLDEDIVGGMLTAVMDLLTNAFVRKGEIKKEIGFYKFEFGEKHIILDNGNNFFIALVLTGKVNEALLKKVEATIQKIEETYGDIFIDWKGGMSDFKGIDEIIMGLMPLEELSEEERVTIKDKGILKKAQDLWAKMYED